ncbi:Alpha,alpha-trehalose-phosphate synthase [UDP-forming] 5, partial [Cucurbita argyrosperma subsp. argyrosperma]
MAIPISANISCQSVLHLTIGLPTVFRHSIIWCVDFDLKVRFATTLIHSVIKDIAQKQAMEADYHTATTQIGPLSLPSSDDITHFEVVHLPHILKRQKDWETSVSVTDFDWKQIAEPVMQLYTETTDGSTIETKESVLVWNYLYADPDFGSCQAKELLDHLESVLANEPVSVKSGQHIVEVKPQGVNKGIVAEYLLQTMREKGMLPDFVLCIGDDRSDEDMFEVITSAKPTLPPNAEVFGCTVGQKPSKAKYYLEDTHEILRMLQGLTHASEHAARATAQTTPHRVIILYGDPERCGGAYLNVVQSSIPAGGCTELCAKTNTVSVIRISPVCAFANLMDSSIAIGIVILSISLILSRVLYVLYWSGRPLPNKSLGSVSTLIVLGSGGHTAEMLNVLSVLQKDLFSPRFYIAAAATDYMSLQKARTYEHQLPHKVRYQGLQTSLIFLNKETREGIVWPMDSLQWPWYNCIPLCAIAFIFKVVGIRWSSIFYVESIARVKRSSLSGYILYKLHMADQFFVQWPQLHTKYPHAHYVGCLV